MSCLRIRDFSDLAAADDRTLLFGGMGLLTDGKLRPEDAASFQQRLIASADLIEAVPDATAHSFERLRELHTYGVLWYDAFTVCDDLRWIVLELALRERFVAFYEGQIPLVDKQGRRDTFRASEFDAIGEAFRWGGSHAKRWRLPTRAAPESMRMPLALSPLLRWARREGLLAGQRNRYLEEEVFAWRRNRFAHGGTYSVETPNHSARGICELAEIINRLWGQNTPGGRLYPGPLERDVLVVGWSPDTADAPAGASLISMHASQLAEHTDEGPGWQYIVIRGVWTDTHLSRFDTRHELTSYPTQLLWGPSTRSDAAAWLAETAPNTDHVTYLDRLFALRRDQGKVFPPCGPDVFLGLSDAARDGTWHLIRADFPTDALSHARHVDIGEPCPRDEFGFGGCPVDDIATGAWSEIAEVVRRELPGLRPAVRQAVHVPGHRSLP